MSGKERLLFESPSMFDRLTVTEGDDGLRTLWFGRQRVRHGVAKLAEPAHLESPCVPVMLAGLALARPLRDVWMIGLGAGVIPRFVRAYLPAATVEVVEIDPLVIDVARRFFAVEADERLRIHEGDGRKLLAAGIRPQDAVILDGHGLGGVPRHLSTCEFLASVRAALAPSGVVVANVWSAAANRHYDATLATYREVFERVHVLDVVGLGNKIIIASAEPGALTREEVVARAHALSLEQRLPIDLGLHVHGVHAVDDLRVRASALRDPSFSW